MYFFRYVVIRNADVNFEEILFLIRIKLICTKDLLANSLIYSTFKPIPAYELKRLCGYPSALLPAKAETSIIFQNVSSYDFILSPDPILMIKANTLRFASWHIFIIQRIDEILHKFVGFKSNDVSGFQIILIMLF